MSGGIPLQQDMDMSDPKQHVLWALMKLNEKVGAPMLMMRPVLEEQSERLYARGFRHHPELQTEWYHPPDEQAGIFGNVSGQWRDHPPAPDEKQAEQVSEALKVMSPSMKAELKKQLEEG